MCGGLFENQTVCSRSNVDLVPYDGKFWWIDVLFRSQDKPRAETLRRDICSMRIA
jgi:hypothetical protein